MADQATGMVKLRCMVSPKGVASQASYGNESFDIDENGIALVTPETARHLVSEQPQVWVAEELDAKLATGQPIPFQQPTRKEVRDLREAGEIPAVEKISVTPREGNS